MSRLAQIENSLDTLGIEKYSRTWKEIDRGSTECSGADEIHFHRHRTLKLLLRNNRG